MSEFLTFIEVLAIHQDQIERYGGSHGLRIPGSWKRRSTAHRPVITEVLEEGAALWESLGRNHAFIDGNKRTAFAAMVTFLGINGIELTADPAVTYVFIAGLYQTNSFGFKQLLNWLRANTTSA